MALLFGGAFLLFHFKDSSPEQIVREIKSWAGLRQIRKAPPGIRAKDKPTIVPIAQLVPTVVNRWQEDQFYCHARAHYTARGVVLHKWMDLKGSKQGISDRVYSRMTLCLGFQQASDQQVIDSLRFYDVDDYPQWGTKPGFPHDKMKWTDLIQQICFLKIVADKTVEDRLISSVEPGQVIRISGYLVDLESAEKGNYWWDRTQIADDTADKTPRRLVRVEKFAIE